MLSNICLNIQKYNKPVHSRARYYSILLGIVVTSKLKFEIPIMFRY